MLRPRPSADRIADLLDVMQALRAVSPVFSTGAAAVFLELVARGGTGEVREIADATGIPFSQACRFAGNLSDGVTRNVSGLGLVAREAGPVGVQPLRLTRAGWDLAARLGAAAGAGLAEAA